MERSQQRNVSFDYDIKQTRDKFKRCVSVCREAALKIKTGYRDFKRKRNMAHGLVNYILNSR